MKVVWDEIAENDLVQIADHIAQDSPAAAVRLVRRIDGFARTLEDFPERHRAGAVPGTREFPLPGTPYILVYCVLAERREVRILAVFHTAQNRPRG